MSSALAADAPRPLRNTNGMFAERPSGRRAGEELSELRQS